MGQALEKLANHQTIDFDFRYTKRRTSHSIQSIGIARTLLTSECKGLVKDSIAFLFYRKLTSISGKQSKKPSVKSSIVAAQSLMQESGALWKASILSSP